MFYDSLQSNHELKTVIGIECYLFNRITLALKCGSIKVLTKMCN